MDSILFVSRHCPGERLFGSDTRTVQVLRRLAKSGRRIHFAHLTRKFVVGRPRGEVRSLLTSYHRLQVAGCRTPGVQPLQWRSLTRPRTASLQRLISRWQQRQTLGQQIDGLLQSTGANVLWLDHGYIAPAIAGMPRRDGVVRVVDTHDVMHLRDASFLARGFPAEHEVSRDEEQHLLSAFDVIVAIQDQERKVLERLLPTRTVVTVGHSLETAPQPCTTNDICFVGSRYMVNESSLLAFVEQAWPTIRDRFPTAKLQVAGGVCQRGGVMQAARYDDRIVLRGLIRRVADMYDGPAVVVCPLWVGSGLKIKMVEALAHGKAVVATPVAIQGLEDGIDDAFVLVQRPADFIEPVSELLENAERREALEREAARYARERFAEERVWRRLDEILRGGPETLARAA